MINFIKNQKKKSSKQNWYLRGALSETKWLGRELLLPVVREFVDDLVNGTNIAFQTVERLADDVASEVVAVFSVERFVSVYARLVAVLRKYPATISSAVESSVAVSSISLNFAVTFPFVSFARAIIRSAVVLTCSPAIGSKVFMRTSSFLSIFGSPSFIGLLCELLAILPD